MHQRRSVGVHPSDDFADLLPALLFLRFLERRHGKQFCAKIQILSYALAMLAKVLIRLSSFLREIDLFAAVNCQVTPVRDVYMDSSVKTVDAGNTGQAFIYNRACIQLISSDFEPFPIRRSATRTERLWTLTIDNRLYYLSLVPRPGNEATIIYALTARLQRR